MKYDWVIFAQRGIRIAPFDDTMLMSYVLEAGLHGHGMDELSGLHLGHTPISYAEVAGKGKDKISFDAVDLKAATRYAAEDADVTLRLHALLKPRLVAAGKVSVYETLERPLVPVLAEMERAGIAIDPDLLRKALQRFRAGHGEAGKGDSQARRRGVQHRLAQAAGRDPVRKIFAAGRQEDQDRRLVHRCRHAGHAGRPGPRHRAEGARLAPALQTARHLYRCAARPYQSADGPRAHLLRDGLDLDGPAGLDRSQSAEHSDPHRSRPQDPHRLHSPRRATSSSAPTIQPDRTAPARPYRRHSGAQEGLRRRASTFMP